MLRSAAIPAVRCQFGTFWAVWKSAAASSGGEGCDRAENAAMRRHSGGAVSVWNVLGHSEGIRGVFRDAYEPDENAPG